MRDEINIDIQYGNSSFFISTEFWDFFLNFLRFYFMNEIVKLLSEINFFSLKKKSNKRMLRVKLV